MITDYQAARLEGRMAQIAETMGFLVRRTADAAAENRPDAIAAYAAALDWLRKEREGVLADLHDHPTHT